LADNNTNNAGTNVMTFLTGIQPTTPTASGVKNYALSLSTNNTFSLPPNTANTIALNGTNIVLGQLGTTSNLVQDVSEYDYAGITWQNVMPAGSLGATNQPYGVFVYRSYDGGQIFESASVLNWTNVSTAAQAATGITNQFTTNLNCQAATTIGFIFTNGTATGLPTNGILRVNLKSPKFGAVPQSY
jgi:hypothetical protein